MQTYVVKLEFPDGRIHVLPYTGSKSDARQHGETVAGVLAFGAIEDTIKLTVSEG